MEYLDSQEIREKHNNLRERQQRSSWDVRSGKFLDLVRRFLPDKTAAITDCGSADGSLILQLTEHGYRNLFCVDIDDYRQLAAKSIPFFKADLCFDQLPWPDNSLDGVLSCQTIEHLENPYHFIREAHRALKPGGILIISTPNPFHLLNRLLFFRHGNLYHFLEGDNHITFFTRAIFKKTFLKYFRLLSTNYGKPEFKLLFLNPLLKKILPANQWFARYIYYVLQKPK